MPGKKQNRREALREILAQLPAQSGTAIRIAMASGEEVSVSVDDLCVKQLSRGALVRRDGDGRWHPADAVTDWLNDDDDVKFAEYLHANVKLFGELLENIEGARSKNDFIGIANRYGLPWASTDQLYRRVGWMEMLGLVERWGSNKCVITEDGKEFLRRVTLTTAAEAVGVESEVSDDEVTLPPPGNVVEALLRSSAERRMTIGYIPRGRKAPERDSTASSQAPLDAIRTLVALVGESVTVEEYSKRCLDQLGVKQSSATQTMHTMRQMRVFDMVAYNQYGPNPDVVELLDLGNELDFVRYLHSRYHFIGEVLAHLDEATPVPEVARIASERYGFTSIDSSEIRIRMGFLADAGLVDRIDWTRYRATSLGKMLVEELTLESPLGSEAEHSIDESDATGSDSDETERIIADLREYGRRADRSEEFERTVAYAFSFLGFSTQHMGGAGRTDVVVDAELPGKDSYRVIVDAKASGTGIISDNAVKFDALKDHQKKHRADFGAVVGPDFADRVREWASNNKFTLLTIEDLANLMARHSTHPLTLIELRMLFQREGDDLADIEEQYAASSRSAALLAKIVELLYEEACEDDPLLEGYISLEAVSYALRKEFTPRPTQGAVEESLQFLGHDLVRGVVRNGTKYKLADAPVNIKRRLAGLGVGMSRSSIA
ncbi:restriction endonuclease [Pseudonocardia yunnanensis]|uniref:Restriction endonuclease n=1 Tax=Pseudonocardia yunnanensis TaxID=58107 RepID=A0ABW4EQY4_9PSEU